MDPVLLPPEFRQSRQDVRAARPGAGLRAVSYPLRGAGDRPIQRTVRYMRALVEGNEGARHPLVRQAALDAVRGVENKDARGEMEALFWWVKRAIAFRSDPVDDELLQTPLVILQQQAGDCDDHAVLMAALANALGIETRFVTVAADRDAPQDFSHVFTEAHDRKTGEWVALDSSARDSFPGWQPAGVTRRQSWPATHGDSRKQIQAIGRALGDVAQSAALTVQNLASAAQSLPPAALALVAAGALLALSGASSKRSRR